MIDDHGVGTQCLAQIFDCTSLRRRWRKPSASVSHVADLMVSSESVDVIYNPIITAKPSLIYSDFLLSTCKFSDALLHSGVFDAAATSTIASPNHAFESGSYRESRKLHIRHQSLHTLE